MTIFDWFAGSQCEVCKGWKHKQVAFCIGCYKRLPKLLQHSLWKRFGGDFEQAYRACLSWFRLNPSAAAPTPKPQPRPAQRSLFPKG